MSSVSQENRKQVLVFFQFELREFGDAPIIITLLDGLLMFFFCKWFEPRSHIVIRSIVIVRVSVVVRRTVWGDIDWRFDNLSGSKDSDDDFRSGCRNVSQCHLKQSFWGLHSPGRSPFTESWCFFCFLFPSAFAYYPTEEILHYYCCKNLTSPPGSEHSTPRHSPTPEDNLPQRY